MAPPPQPPLPNLFFFLLTAIFSLPTTTTARTTFYDCSATGDYAANTTFEAALLHLLSNLTAAAPPAGGFSNLTFGDDPNSQVSGLALCRGDQTADRCRSCLTNAAADVVDQCPSSLSGGVWYDECRLRYSYRPFFSALTPNPPNPYYYSYRRVLDRSLYQEKFAALMRGLQEQAATGAKLFAVGAVNYTAEQSLYGLVQCTRDLSGDQCSECLEEPIRQVGCCMDSTDVTFQGGSCYLRCSFDPFFNATVTGLRRPDNSTMDIGPISLPTAAKKSKSAATIVVAALGVCILLLLVAAVIKTKWKRKPKHITLGGKNLQLNEGSGLKFNRLTSKKISFFQNTRSPDSQVQDLQKLDLQMMKLGTENFSDAKRLGRGDFGLVYKGDLHGQEFAVKRLTGKPRLELMELKKEIKALKQLQHPNLARILAFHIEEQEKFVVYEYLPNRSLDKILFDPKRRILLDWGRRYKIIEGISRGLLHLHEDSGLNIIHQDLKASNILLDKQMTPKISDYGLATLFEATQNQGNPRKISSSQGYMESAAGGIPSAKSEVFSYGVLVLEIVTGQRNRDFLGSENAANLLSYVWQYWREEKALQVLDWSLGELYKGHEVLRCIHVGLLCVQDDADKRPNMSTVVHMLNSYSFTLPSPSAPAVVKGRKPPLPPSKDLLTGNENGNGPRGNWDWKTFNQNVSQLSP